MKLIHKVLCLIGIHDWCANYDWRGDYDYFCTWCDKTKDARCL